MLQRLRRMWMAARDAWDDLPGTKDPPTENALAGTAPTALRRHCTEQYQRPRGGCGGIGESPGSLHPCLDPDVVLPEACYWAWARTRRWRVLAMPTIHPRYGGWAVAWRPSRGCGNNMLTTGAATRVEALRAVCLQINARLKGQHE